jgi:hypothetical protein
MLVGGELAGAFQSIETLVLENVTTFLTTGAASTTAALVVVGDPVANSTPIIIGVVVGFGALVIIVAVVLFVAFLKISRRRRLTTENSTVGIVASNSEPRSSITIVSTSNNPPPPPPEGASASYAITPRSEIKNQYQNLNGSGGSAYSLPTKVYDKTPTGSRETSPIKLKNTSANATANKNLNPLASILFFENVKSHFLQIGKLTTLNFLLENLLEKVIMDKFTKENGVVSLSPSNN